MKHKIIKTIEIIFIVSCFVLCQQVSIPNNVSKTNNSNLNKTLDLHAMALKIEEIQKNDLYTPKDVYNGYLTGYVANCPLCGGTLGCTGQNVLDGTTHYQDSMYGDVRIVASSQSLPCGSIVQFTLSKLQDDPITAIVLDRGVTGTTLDLLVNDEDYAKTSIGSTYLSYNILRFGYTR